MKVFELFYAAFDKDCDGVICEQKELYLQTLGVYTNKQKLEKAVKKHFKHQNIPNSTLVSIKDNEIYDKKTNKKLEIEGEYYIDGDYDFAIVKKYNKISADDLEGYYFVVDCTLDKFTDDFVLVNKYF